MRATNRGQALVESLFILALLFTLLQVFSATVQPLHKQQLGRLEQARRTLWSLPQAEQVSTSSRYAFAERARAILSPLKSLTGLVLANDNLLITEENDGQARLARLDDTWSPLTPQDLTERVAKLTPFAATEKLGLSQVQDIISWLHFTEEFSSERLRFGHVDADVTPAELSCKEAKTCSR